MRFYYRIFVLSMVIGVGISGGCGKDRAKEFFAEQERLEQEKQTPPPPDSPTVSELDLKKLLEPKPKVDPSIPPPKLVDIRTLEEKFPDGKLRIRRTVKYFSDNSTVNHGPYTEWHPNGQKFCEGRYEDGKRVGEWTYYYEDGSKAKMGTYKDGQLDGLWTYWSQGQPDKPIRQEEYRAGQRHGKWITWNEQGQKIREETYAHNQLEGPVTEWYPNGQMKIQVHYKQGLPDGKVITWDEQGRKISERTFRAGQPLP
ncbi:MAG: toxin-antitoxin system YwqK family antitoxin [Thermoguttaceae bacterium]|nr:toxin-antitoxin system YwqK family antitoxin [Thermoguttaceae bacterium]MDW8038756.1 toxin-antitoxin system YwqK family antitoxin [Thermoguttaceae bacterium]